MPNVIQKYSWDWFVANASPELVALVVIVFLVSYLTYQASTAHTAAKKERSDNETTRRQQEKAERLLVNCPCISKKNSNWLRDIKEGGEPPDDKIHCAYLEAREKGEI